MKLWEYQLSLATGNGNRWTSDGLVRCDQASDVVRFSGSLGNRGLTQFVTWQSKAIESVCYPR